VLITQMNTDKSLTTNFKISRDKIYIYRITFSSSRSYYREIDENFTVVQLGKLINYFTNLDLETFNLMTTK